MDDRTQALAHKAIDAVQARLDTARRLVDEGQNDEAKAEVVKAGASIVIAQLQSYMVLNDDDGLKDFLTFILNSAFGAEGQVYIMDNRGETKTHPLEGRA